MPLTRDEAMDVFKDVKASQDAERRVLDRVRRYWKGRQALLAVIPKSAPREVRTMARIARVNICDIVVDSLTQSTIVDGYRIDAPDAEDEETREAQQEADGRANALWRTWQANRFDARQTGLHAASYAYGTAYNIVLPGDPEPVWRPRSPRQLTAMYGEDPDWPIWALERWDSKSYRLYDELDAHFIGANDRGDFQHLETRRHGAEVCPVVRYRDSEDLDVDDDVEPDGTVSLGESDGPMLGQVAPLMPVQDQIDLTTFGLLVAQHYQAFKQRVILGWVDADEEKVAKAAASQILAFKDHPDDIKIDEWGETNLKGYIDSREASLRHGATLSQTPVHELTGQLINMAADALAAAEAGRDRKVDVRKMLNGESHEQSFWLSGRYKGVQVPVDAQIVWRDTSARAFAATVDGLGKAVQMLNVPPQELWSHIASALGATQQDVARWKRSAESGDSLATFTEMLERQMAGVNGDG